MYIHVIVSASAAWK